MDIAKRIAQFENMAQADPTNEMAHFSLGKAYGEAERWRDAAESYLRAVKLMPDMSKAYQMAGEMLVKAGQADRAIDVLTDGFRVAAERGDLMPRNAMGLLLKQLGATVPDVAGGKGDVALHGPVGGPRATGAASMIDPANVPEGMIVCRQSGRLGTKMTRPPFRGPVGEWIASHISAETWRVWIGQGTKVINELRLDLSRDKDQEAYDQAMREYLGVPEEVK